MSMQLDSPLVEPDEVFPHPALTKTLSCKAMRKLSSGEFYKYTKPIALKCSW